METGVVIDDCRTAMAAMEPDSIDAIVTDPPYSLGFMGKVWDSTGIANEVVMWQQCLRVLKPGGHLLAFGGTRTYHRMVCAIEDAGFEIRDSLMWIYASGFPKGKSALKPSHEPIVLARKPLEGTITANVIKWSTGALNVEECRVETSGRSYRFGGRWPPNTIASHSPDCTDPIPCVDGCSVAELDAQSGNVRSPQSNGRRTTNAGWSGEFGVMRQVASYTDSGGASKFFPTFRYQAKAPKSERPCVSGVSHPTVKPLMLMRWLVRLVTPPGGIVFDPFAGTGTTMEAAILEGLIGRGIESDPECLPLIEQRLERV